jgi:hypothetical protein
MKAISLTDKNDFHLFHRRVLLRAAVFPAHRQTGIRRGKHTEIAGHMLPDEERINEQHNARPGL